MRNLHRLVVAAVLLGGLAGLAWADEKRPAAPKEPTAAPTKEAVRVAFSIGGVT